MESENARINKHLRVIAFGGSSVRINSMEKRSSHSKLNMTAAHLFWKPPKLNEKKHTGVSFI